MSPEETIHFDELGLKFGQPLEMAAQGGREQAFANVLVVGALPGESLIISVDESGIFPKTEEGQKAVFRVRMADGVAVFSGTVLYITDVPIFMVFVDFPTEVTFRRIRNATRVRVNLPVLVSSLSDSHRSGMAGRIVDISTSGAGLEMFENVGETGEEITLKGKFAVGSIRRVLSIKGVIRSIKKKGDNSYICGVEFLEEDENDLLVLFGFIFNAMSFGDIQKIR